MGIAFVLSTPAGLLTSLVGIFFDKRKGAAIAGVVVSGVTATLFLTLVALSVWVRASATGCP